MVTLDNGETETKDDDDNDFMPPLKDAINCEYVVSGQA